MKRLIVVRGTMGAGKSAACRELLHLLQPGVWLDGDWCWMMEPFVPNGENRAMVMENICILLRNFMRNTQLEYVIFCWVLHQDEILDDLLARLAGEDFCLTVVTLDITEASLRQRLEGEIRRGTRAADVVERSVARLPLYHRLRGRHLDVSRITAKEAAETIAQWVKESGEAGA